MLSPALESHEIQPAVAIEITHRNVDCSIDVVESLLLEGPISIAKDDRDAVVIVVGDREIEATIAVEVAHCHGIRHATGGNTPRQLERPIATAQQDRHLGA